MKNESCPPFSRSGGAFDRSALIIPLISLFDISLIFSDCFPRIVICHRKARYANNIILTDSEKSRLIFFSPEILVRIVNKTKSMKYFFLVVLFSQKSQK